jgi:hypothetical protein
MRTQSITQFFILKDQMSVDEKTQATEDLEDYIKTSQRVCQVPKYFRCVKRSILGNKMGWREDSSALAESGNYILTRAEEENRRDPRSNGTWRLN